MTIDRTSDVWFVTGVSRGLGRGIAEAVLESGRRLVGTVRSPDHVAHLRETYGDRVAIATADVSDKSAVQAAVDFAVQTFGRIDVVVNNAGYALMAGIEDASEDQIRDQFETNVFGAFNVCRAALPILRHRGRGHIVLISSVAGACAGAGTGYYAASKHAIEGFGEAMSKECAPLGIRVSIVQPGVFRTDALGDSMRVAEPSAAYEGGVGAVMGRLSGLNGAQPGNPTELGHALIALSQLEQPPLRVPIDPGASTLVRGRLETQLAELEEWAPKLATEPIG